MDSAARTITRIAGPSLIALAATERMNMSIFASQIAPVVYLNGALLFVAGVAIVQAHNRWSWRWPLAVTLAGWVISLLGLFRMIAPRAAQAQAGPLTDAAFVALGAVGAFFCWKGYGRRRDTET